MEKGKKEKESSGDSEKLVCSSSIEDFIPWLVYRLNMHLSSVVGYAQLLLSKASDSESTRDLEKIIEEAHRASQVIKDLLDFNRKKRLKKEVVDLNKLIESVIEEKIRKLSFSNIKVVKELSPNLPLTLVDPEQIRQALVNIINESEEGIREFHGFGEIRVKTSEVGGQIEIVISDDGPGIPTEEASRVFDPFFTWIRGRGTGLELALSREIVMNHGGTMRFESEWGKGSTFILTLPVSRVKGERERALGAEKSLIGLKGLVIDDDINILEIVSKYFEEMGCEIVTSSDARMALNILEEKEFDFVICDVVMPEMNGIDFYRILEERRPSLVDRVIFSTGDIMRESTQGFLESLPNLHITKPFDLNRLKEIIIRNLETLR